MKAINKHVTVTRISAKQKFQEYKNRARVYIDSLRFPRTSPILSLESYTDVNGAKKPNAASVPELLAIVGTAAKLGKDVRVHITGINVLTFSFVDQKPDFPLDLL